MEDKETSAVMKGRICIHTKKEILDKLIAFFSRYAYSCMMTLAQGFGNILRDATNASHTLNHMAYRQLGAELNPSVFNTTYVGPGGPIILDQNGDLTIG
jgi:hypothetical protein